MQLSCDCTCRDKLDHNIPRMNNVLTHICKWSRMCWWVLASCILTGECQSFIPFSQRDTLPLFYFSFLGRWFMSQDLQKIIPYKLTSIRIFLIDCNRMVSFLALREVLWLQLVQSCLRSYGCSISKLYCMVAC